MTNSRDNRQNNINRITKDDIAFSVLMPTYNQCAFIRRAIKSLIRQTHKNWELIIVDDGSTDQTFEYISDYLEDSRIKYIRCQDNKGFGYAINRGIEEAAHDYIAYLPTDDIFYENHLETLATALTEENAVLAFSGIRFDAAPQDGLLDYKNCKGAIPGYCTQLVQVAHRKTDDRWTERSECVSEDLFFLFWRKLTGKGIFVPTGKVTCEWTSHPHQHHKVCGEKHGGGLNKYRAFYGVKTPLRFRSGVFKTFDEIEAYSQCRSTCGVAADGLKILLVGELAYNPERVYALEKSGHKLYALWANPRFGYSTVGPLPFGHVTDVPRENWKEEIARIQPDIIYALLSTSAIELAHEVLEAGTGIPFVWHFKEGPHEAQKAGLWGKLIDLYAKSDGCIYLNDEEQRWIEMFTPRRSTATTLLLDGDLPPAANFSDSFSPKLSDSDGEIHTVVAGRMVGITPNDYRILAKNGINLHIYSENMTANEDFLPYINIDSSHFHIHSHCPQQKWAEEFSRYDAGWLHCIDSCNNGNILNVTWADINLPARISTYLVAGIPMIQKRNGNHIFAQRSYLKPYDIDIPFDNMQELASSLRNSSFLNKKRQNVLAVRHNFSFEAHEEELVDFFRRIISLCANKK